jgi:tRNA-2-methylthio-N6-dimethylallyladenosine synthase
LGQTVNAYHDGQSDFAALLRRANEVEGIARIRFTSPHPSDMSDPVIRAMAECKKVCPQVHLPVQSGSTAVPGRMERGYTVDEYLRLVRNLRGGADIAFPPTPSYFTGESEEDFRPRST